MRIWGKNRCPDFVVDRVPFADYPKSPNNICFPHVRELFLLDYEITKDNAWLDHHSKESFKKQSSGLVTALIEVEALTGTKGRLKWNPCRTEGNAEFEKSWIYRWWSHIPMNNLPIGHCSIEICLDEIRWLIADFEMMS
jgi:hypothetical protein